MGSVTERDCLLTLVERSTGLALVAKLPHRTTTAVNRAALKLIRESGLPFKTITWDNGTDGSTFPNEEALPKYGKATATPSPTSSTTGPGNAMATSPPSSDSKNYSGCCTSRVDSPATQRPAMRPAAAPPATPSEAKTKGSPDAAGAPSCSYRNSNITP